MLKTTPNLNAKTPLSLSLPTNPREKATIPPSEEPTVVPPPPPISASPNPQSQDDKHTVAPPALHPRVAVILGVDRKWYVPLLVCRALSTAPAAWWGLRCAFTFLAELLHITSGMGREGWAAAIVGSIGADWDVERRFRVTEVALAIMWVCMRALGVKRRGQHGMAF